MPAGIGCVTVTVTKAKMEYECENDIDEINDGESNIVK
jgi:hypothetical protein